MLFSRLKDHRCYGNTMIRTFRSGAFVNVDIRFQNGIYIIGIYIVNRILHGCLEIRNFSSRVEKYLPCFLRSLGKFSCNILYLFSFFYEVFLQVLVLLFCLCKTQHLKILVRSRKGPRTYQCITLLLTLVN